MAVEQLITQHIDTWTSALRTRSTAGRGTSGKIDLYGIKKLRELILELAVRGKLVPQDPNDEPASELLKRIAAEKAELVKQGKIKKQKSLPEINEEEKPFELPVGWEWVRLGDVVKVSSGDGLTSSQMNDAGNIPVYGGNGINGYHDLFNVSKRTIVIGRVGFYCGSIHVTPNHAWVTDNAFITEFSESNFYFDYLEMLLTITNLKENENATAQPVISGKKIYPIVIAIPTYQEQKKIVRKVNELMSLCDQLEQQSLTSLEAHSQLVETLLSTLTASQNAEELAENWARISEHFDTLFTTEASIDALKQTILQLAVMGKLVPQDANDEPASELLKRIEQEKAQLVKEGKIKKQKPLPPISEDEKPFELPVGWVWCRLGHCIHLISGQHLKPNEYTENIIEGAIPYITGPAEFGDLNPTYSKFTIEKRAVAEPKDILVTCKGAGLGKLNVANVEIAISRQLMAIRTVCANCDYFKLLLSSMYDYFQAKGVGIAIPGISREDVIEPVISLPPLNEQERIVSRVNALFGTCDHLKSRLQSAQQTQFHLADALTDAALN